jgi:hypothetical protein
MKKMKKMKKEEMSKELFLKGMHILSHWLWENYEKSLVKRENGLWIRIKEVSNWARKIKEKKEQETNYDDYDYYDDDFCIHIVSWKIVEPSKPYHSLKPLKRSEKTLVDIFINGRESVQYNTGPRSISVYKDRLHKEVKKLQYDDFACRHCKNNNFFFQHYFYLWDKDDSDYLHKCDDCHTFLMKNKKETGHDEGWYAVCDSCYHIKTEHAS